MEELFKDIKGYEGYYQVSNYGRVKACKREIYQELNTKKGTNSFMYRTIKERYLVLNNATRTGKGNSYYSYVSLCKEGITKRFTVHKLVMMTFHPIDEYETINHIDGNGLNNHISNLEYCTNIDNVRHYLKSIGKDIIPVINKTTGQKYESLRQAGMDVLKKKGIIDYNKNKLKNTITLIKKQNKVYAVGYPTAI